MDATYTEMLIDNAATASQNATLMDDPATREAIRLNIIDPLLALASHEPAPEPAKDGPEVVGMEDAFSHWFEHRGVWPRVTYQEAFFAGYQALQAENERLREALEPFARMEHVFIQVAEGGYFVGCDFGSQPRLNDFRRARAALKGQSNE